MPSLLTAASVLQCPHGGMVMASPGSSKAQAASPILRGSDSFTIAGCPFATPAGPHPCVSINWVQTAARVKHDGDFVLTESSVGLCIAADQTPQGPVVISSTQPMVSGL